MKDEEQAPVHIFYKKSVNFKKLNFYRKWRIGLIILVFLALDLFCIFPVYFS